MYSVGDYVNWAELSFDKSCLGWCFGKDNNWDWQPSNDLGLVDYQGAEEEIGGYQIVDKVNIGNKVVYILEEELPYNGTTLEEAIQNLKEIYY